MPKTTFIQLIPVDGWYATPVEEEVITFSRVFAFALDESGTPYVFIAGDKNHEFGYLSYRGYSAYKMNKCDFVHKDDKDEDLD